MRHKRGPAARTAHRAAGRGRIRRVLLMAGAVAAGLVTAACSTQAPAGTVSPSAGPGGSGTPSAAAATAAIEHVVIIIEENKPESRIIGSPEAPYINRLAADNALATNYRAVTHPSLPNYLALTGGSTAGITNDCPPGDGCMAQGSGIAGTVEKSGRSWKMYAEAMPAPCTPTSSGDYAVKHNPFLYYPGVIADKAHCAAHDVPFTQLAADLKDTSTLPDYVFISPDLCHDMHDCSVQTGDDWLARHVPAILASPAFTRQNSLLVITWDEGNAANNNVSTIFAGPAAKKAFRSDTPYTHYSLLRTIEDVWDLPPLTGKDGEVTAMTDMLR